MENLFNVLIPLALAAVSLILLLGLWNLMKGRSANLSQKLMRWRVGLQFAAVCMVMAAIYFTAR